MPRTPLVLLPLGLLLSSCVSGWMSSGDPHLDELSQYIDEHYAAQGQRFVIPLDRDQFRRRLQHSAVLFLGDHHRDQELHLQMAELIEELSRSERGIVLGLEAIGLQDNAALQEYLQGAISMAELQHRMRTRWEFSWLENPDVDAAFFRALLRHCRREKIPVFPLEPTPRLGLQERDRRITQSVLQAQRLHPERLVVVVLGHAHLLGPHHVFEQVTLELPAVAISARMAPRLRRQFERGRPGTRAPAGGFLRTDRELLFFAPPAPEPRPDLQLRAQ